MNNGKPAYAKKLNWTGLIIFVAGVMVDPNFLKLIPETWGPLFLQVGGLVTLVISQFFTRREQHPQAGA